MPAPALRITRPRPRRTPPGRRAARSSLAIDMGARVGRDSLFYTIVSTIIFPLGLGNALVLTHYLTTTQYGQLSALFVASGLMTVVLNIFFLRGTERRVWGASDEGIDLEQAQLIESHKRPRALGTGIMLSLLLAVLLTLASIPVATPLSRLITDTPHLSSAVIWAAASAGGGAVFRLVWNIVRWERRHVPFGITYILRPLLAIALAWPLVAGGGGVTGAVEATAIATVVASVFGLAVSKRSFVFTLDRESAIDIVRSSASFSMMIVGLYALHNGDVLLLTRYASQSQVGVYRLAGNITSLISYAVSAFLMAWAPLEHGNLFEAAYTRHGRERLRGEFIIYYLIMCGVLTLVLSALATPLVGLFSARYAKAGGFVAITCLGWMAYGLLVVVARSSSFPRRYTVYGIAAMVSVLGLVLTSIVLGPSLGGYGVATGDVVGGMVGVAIIITVAKLFGDTPSVNVWRLGALIAVSAGCYWLGGPIADHSHGAGTLLRIASVALYPVVLAATGVIPLRHFGALWAILRKTLRIRARPEALIEGIGALPGVERRIVLAATRDGEPAERITALTGIPETTVKTRLVAGLRRLAGAGEASPNDGALGDYLLSTWSVTQRDGVARELWDVGIDPVDLHRIESAFDALRAAPARSWAAAVIRGGRDLPPPPWPIDLPDLQLLDEAVRRGRDRGELAVALGLERRDVDRRLVGAVRRLSTGETSRGSDSLIAGFLLDGASGPPPRQLWAAGVDPLELHQLELALAEIRSLGRDRWRSIMADARALTDEQQLAQQVHQ